MGEVIRFPTEEPDELDVEAKKAVLSDRAHFGLKARMALFDMLNELRNEVLAGPPEKQGKFELELPHIAEALNLRGAVEKDKNYAIAIDMHLDGRTRLRFKKAGAPDWQFGLMHDCDADRFGNESDDQEPWLALFFLPKAAVENGLPAVPKLPKGIRLLTAAKYAAMRRLALRKHKDWLAEKELAAAESAARQAAAQKLDDVQKKIEAREKPAVNAPVKGGLELVPAKKTTTKT